MLNQDSDKATLSQVVQRGIDARLKDLHTAMPGIIETFDPTLQLATVQPAVRRVFRSDASGETILVPTDLPLLINVPVIYPRGGGFSLTFPVVKGDECLLVFCEREIDQWHQQGGVQTPNTKRFHALSDAMCFVGVSSVPRKISGYNGSDTELRNDAGDQYIRMEASGGIKIKCTDFVMESDTVTETIATSHAKTCPTNSIVGNEVITGNETVTGTLIVAAINMNTHTHAQANDSGGNTEAATAAPT